jgi:ATP-dependent DNA ligase
LRPAAGSTRSDAPTTTWAAVLSKKLGAAIPPTASDAAGQQEALEALRQMGTRTITLSIEPKLKLDGYRMGCRIEGGRVQLTSRNGNDWTGNFPELVGAAKRLPCRSALLDGEVAVLQPNGLTSFQALQNAVGAKSLRHDVVYFAFRFD